MTSTIAAWRDVAQRSEEEAYNEILQVQTTTWHRKPHR